MDPIQYHNISQYLLNQTYPDNLETPRQKRKFSNFCTSFQINNGFLYKKHPNKIDELLRVIRRNEMEPVLYMMHSDPTGGHLATEAMFSKIRTRYFWPKLYEDIRNYVKTCDKCQRRGKYKKNHELHPIPVHSPFYQIGIDFVGPLPQTSQGNRYIIVAVDYLTKWPEAQPVPSATSEETAKFIYETIICRHGCPQKILSDRGTHFNNKLIEQLMSKFLIKHLLSTPYHPQTNGLVERFNRTLCESLAKLSGSTDWDLMVAPALFAYRSSKHSTTGMSPFYLLYGRDPRLPMDEEEESSPRKLMDRLQCLLDELPLKRLQAKQNVAQQQIKQKQWHDHQLKVTHTFNIGDKVLFFRAEKERQWSGKLDEKWKGPYYIHSVRPHGSYKLRDIYGRVLKAPINSILLKAYHEHQDFLPSNTENDHLLPNPQSPRN